MNVAQRVILLLLVVSLLAGLVWGETLYFRLAYLWGFLFFGGWLWSRLSLRGLRFSRSARALRAQVGQVFEERFEIFNPTRLPRLWLEIRDEAPLTGSKGSRVLTIIGGRQRRSYLARTRLTQRGVFPLGPTHLRSGDLLGIFPVHRTHPSEYSLLVYPMIADIRSFPNPPGLLSGGEALRRRTHQVTPNASGVREYAPGDPLNRIHWASTARRDKFMVKEFELDPLADVWIYLDGDSKVQTALPQPAISHEEDFWRRSVKIPLAPSTEEYGVSIAASLARFYLQHDRAVGLVSAAQYLTLIPPDRGARQLGKILEALALLRADGKLPLRGLVETQARHMTRGSTAVLITPMVYDELTLIVDYLSRRGMRPVVVLLDAESFGGKQGSLYLSEKLMTLGAPVCRVVKGDNLELALSPRSSSLAAPAASIGEATG